MKNVFTVQRSRARWIKERDSKSEFFYACINKRSRDNCIHGLQLGDNWVEEVSQLKEATHNHFMNLFNDQVWERPTLEGVDFNQISEEEGNMLTTEFTIKEIDAAVQNCNSNKSPGPNGYNFAFIKKFWHLFRANFCKMFKEFHLHGKLP